MRGTQKLLALLAPVTMLASLSLAQEPTKQSKKQPLAPSVASNPAVGSATFLTETAEIACDLLFRLRPNRALYGAPPPYSGTGRPALHGAVFRLADPTTWACPYRNGRSFGGDWYTRPVAQTSRKVAGLGAWASA